MHTRAQSEHTRTHASKDRVARAHTRTHLHPLHTQYPAVFSFGLVRKTPPAQKDIDVTSTTMRFLGRGYSSKEKLHSHEQPDLTIVTRLTGPGGWVVSVSQERGSRAGAFHAVGASPSSLFVLLACGCGVRALHLFCFFSGWA